MFWTKGVLSNELKEKIELTLLTVYLERRDDIQSIIEELREKGENHTSINLYLVNNAHDLKEIENYILTDSSAFKNLYKLLNRYGKPKVKTRRSIYNRTTFIYIRLKIYTIH